MLEQDGYQMHDAEGAAMTLTGKKILKAFPVSKLEKKFYRPPQIIPLMIPCKGNPFQQSNVMFLLMVYLSLSSSQIGKQYQLSSSSWK